MLKIIYNKYLAFELDPILKSLYNDLENYITLKNENDSAAKKIHSATIPKISAYQQVVKVQFEVRNKRTNEKIVLIGKIFFIVIVFS